MGNRSAWNKKRCGRTDPVNKRVDHILRTRPLIDHRQRFLLLHMRRCGTKVFNLLLRSHTHFAIHLKLFICKCTIMHKHTLNRVCCCCNLALEASLAETCIIACFCAAIARFCSCLALSVGLEPGFSSESLTGTEPPTSESHPSEMSPTSRAALSDEGIAAGIGD